jgi:hypothetical protein
MSPATTSSRNAGHQLALRLRSSKSEEGEINAALTRPTGEMAAGAVVPAMLELEVDIGSPDAEKRLTQGVCGGRQALSSI